MQPGCRAQVLARRVVPARLAGAMTEPLALAQKEVNDVLRARLAVSNPVLPEHSRRLYEQLACSRPLRCTRYGFCCR